MYIGTVHLYCTCTFQEVKKYFLVTLVHIHQSKPLENGLIILTSLDIGHYIGLGVTTKLVISYQLCYGNVTFV